MYGLKMIIDDQVTNHVIDSDDINYDTNEILIKDFDIDTDQKIWFKIDGNIKLPVNNVIETISGVVIAGLVKRPIPISVKKSILNSFK